MSKSTMRRVLAKLKEIETDDLFVADAIAECIQILEMPKKGGVLPPHQSHSDTSRASAIAEAPTFGMKARTVLVGFAHSMSGLTDEEGQERLQMEGNSYRPCRVTLMDQGLIYDTGFRRKTRAGRPAVVWDMTVKGRETLFLEAGWKLSL
jgi:hypothetical protein